MRVYPIEAGLAVRGQIRRYLMSRGIDFKEDKGWVESTFYCTVTEKQWEIVIRDINNWKGLINSDEFSTTS